MYFSFDKNKFVSKNIEPLKIAISGSDQDITWGNLKEEVEKFISLFNQLGIKRGQIVIIYGDKEIFFLIAILAAIKAGITYVPFDQNYPNEWLQKVKRKTNASVIINSGDYSIDILFPIIINSDLSFKINSQITEIEDHTSYTDPIVYIMFTSGSTGEPKFIQISRSSVLSFIQWLEKDHEFSSKNIFMNHASLSFDLSVYSLYAAFAFGGTLLLIDDLTYQDQDKFFQKLSQYKVNTWISTPSFAHIFLVNQNFCSKKLATIDTFIFIGERLRKKLVSKLWSLFNNVEIINSYGPTEATVATMFVYCKPEMLDNKHEIPIGIDRINGEVILLNNNKQGKEGEIVIIGDQVSLGYLKMDQTNFFKYNNKRAFRTGDYGFMYKEKLYFLGRKDSQIKYNGYRIELENITSVFLEFDFVENAITISLKRGDKIKKIVSFVTLINNHDISSKKLRDLIESKLPFYMLPSDIKVIRKFPINRNNKIDEKQLLDLYMNNKF